MRAISDPQIEVVNPLQEHVAQGFAPSRSFAGAHLAVLAGAVVLGAILRLVGLTRQGFWVDELYVVWEGRQPLDRIFDPNLHIQHPPGYRLLMHAWMGLDVDEWWIRLVPALAGILLVPVVWALARTLWPAHPEVASLGAILVATSPFLKHYSQDVTTYSWTTTWIALSFLLLVLAWRRNRAWLWVVWGLSLAVAMYSHYFAIFPLLIEAAGVVVIGIREGNAVRRKLVTAAAVVASAAALYVPWAYILLSQGQGLPNALFPLTVDCQPVRWLSALLVGYTNTVFWLYQIGLVFVWLASGACLLWAAWLLARTRGTSHPKAVALVLAWCIAALAGPYFFLKITTPPGSEDPVRFATFAVPPLLLGLAALIVSMPVRLRAVALALWLAVAGVQWWSELTGPPQQDWRGLLSVVASDGQPGDVLLAFPAFHTGAAAAYYPVPMTVEGGWFVSEGEDPAGAAYWFPPDWHWDGFYNTEANRSTGWSGELDRRAHDATRLWYLAGDGLTDGTYRPSPDMEQALTRVGWHEEREWHSNPLVLRLYTRTIQAAP